MQSSRRVNFLSSKLFGWERQEPNFNGYLLANTDGPITQKNICCLRYNSVGSTYCTHQLPPQCPQVFFQEFTSVHKSSPPSVSMEPKCSSCDHLKCAGNAHTYTGLQEHLCGWRLPLQLATEQTTSPQMRPVARETNHKDLMSACSTIGLLSFYPPDNNMA